jgi:large conductance mechanosensitive channel
VGLFKEFRDFAVKGNVIDLAVGVIIGASFGKIVTSLVEDIIMPPIGVILGKVDFTNLYIVLPGQQDKIGEWVLKHNGQQPTSLANFKEAGVATFGYGNFINQTVQFIIVAFAVFLLVHAINKVKARVEPPPADGEPLTKECPFCLSTIPARAAKCAQCTTDLVEAS